MSFSLSMLPGFIALVQAYTTFETTCTTPAAAANFVTSADTRGTMDILWSCLFTIIACTWTIQHLNVPEQREDRDQGWLGDIKWQLKRIWGTTKWMLTTIIAPEVLLGKAWSDLEDAKYELDKLQAFAAEDGVPWTITHSLFANMGGFVIKNNTEKKGIRPRQIDGGTQTDLETLQKIHQGNVVKSTSSMKEHNVLASVVPTSNHDIDSTQILSESNIDSESAPIKKDTRVQQYDSLGNPVPYHLVASDICRLREAGLLARLPYVTIEDIKDKSKSDSFARAIAILQIVWTVVQIIARAIKHLAIAQLEIAVLAFSVCAIIIYGLNWKKPKGVEATYTLFQYRKEIPEQVLWSLEARPSFKSNFFNSLGGSIGSAFGVTEIFSRIFGLKVYTYLRPPISNDDSVTNRNGIFPGFFVGSVLFGALHIAAWNFVFPTRAEQIIWWTTSLLCTSIYILGSVVVLAPIFQESEDLIFVLVSILYILARIFLVVEIFRTLCFLPPEAYVATWASNIPHVA